MNAVYRPGTHFSALQTMHYHLLHNVMGLMWLVKVHILGFFFSTRRLNHITLP